MLFVCTWLWGDKWSLIYAERLFAGLRRNLREQFASVLITDRRRESSADIDIEWDNGLFGLPGCLARIAMFDSGLQDEIGAGYGDRVVNIDVDAVITGPLDPLFDRYNEFTIMQGYNQTNPCPFNGSLWMFRAGERHDVWEDFSLDAFERYKVPIHSIPDDQGWLHHKFPKADAYTTADGVYAFKKIGWKKGRRKLPLDARLVVFPGRDPAKYLECDWIRQHWLGETC